MTAPSARRRGAVAFRVCAVLTCAVLAAGCGTGTPDYPSVWQTGTATSTTTATEAPIPFGQYLKEQGVSGDAVAPDALTDLVVSIPTPSGWSRRHSPQLPATTEVIGKGEQYPTAVLTVFKLNGAADPHELVKRGTADVELQQNFTRLDASDADYQGFPSAMIQGSHDLSGQRLHSWLRMVVATGAAPAEQRYLVQLTIHTLADRAAAQAADVETIINGFTVATK